MPCIDGRERHNDKMSYYAQGILCAIIRKHGEGVLDDLDYKQLGLTKTQVHNWWYFHEREDQLYNQPVDSILDKKWSPL